MSKRGRDAVDSNPPEAQAPPPASAAFCTGLGAPQSPSSAALAQACALLGAADGEAPAAAFLPVGSDWQVLSLVTPDGLRLHAVAPEAVLDVSVAGEGAAAGRERS